MENQNIWKNGYCRVPNSVGRRLERKNRAMVMGLFLWLVQNVRRTEAMEENGGGVQRGQIVVTYTKLADELDLSVWNVREAIAAAVAAGLITSQLTVVGRKRVHLLTVNDFSSYNGVTAGLEMGAHSVAGGASHSSFRSALKGSEERKDETTMSKGSSCFSSCKAAESGVSGSVNDDVNAMEKKEIDVVEKDCGMAVSGGAKSSREVPVVATAAVPVQELEGLMLGQEDWREHYQFNHGLSNEQMERWVKEFVVHLQSTGVRQKGLLDAMSHFTYWHRKREVVVGREEREREEARRRECEKLEERRRAVEEEKARMERESQEAEERHLRVMREAARNGDEYAQQILRKYGFDY